VKNRTKTTDKQKLKLKGLKTFSKKIIIIIIIIKRKKERYGSEKGRRI